ncbi:MAG: C25 family cysteine peptidase [Candidatus Eisenbacteria bacterium]
MIVASNAPCGSTYVYTTPCGGTGKAADITMDWDMTEEQREFLREYFETLYPEVEYVGQATWHQTCHAYAWLDSAMLVVPGDMLMPFLDSYEQSSESLVTYGAIIGDPAEDPSHSAVVLDTFSGTVPWAISKWGEGPVFKHHVDYGPFGAPIGCYKRKSCGFPSTADICDLRIHKGILSWHALRESNTKYYEIEACEEGTEHWVSLNRRIEARGPGTSYRIDGVEEYDRLILIEIEDVNGEIRRQIRGSVERASGVGAGYNSMKTYIPRRLIAFGSEGVRSDMEDFVREQSRLGFSAGYEVVPALTESLLAYLRTLKESGDVLPILWKSSRDYAQTPASKIATNPEVLIIAPVGLNTGGALNAYAAAISSMWGYQVRIDSLSAPYSADTVLARIMAVSPTVPYVLLFGRTLNQNAGSTTMPVWYLEDPTADSTYGAWTRFISSLVFYEGEPDTVLRRVGYLPAETAADVLLYREKMLDYVCNWPWEAGYHARTLGRWIFDYDGTIESEELNAYLSYGEQFIHCGWNIEDLRATEVGGGTWNGICPRREAFHNALEDGRSIVATFATNSDADNYGFWWYQSMGCSYPVLDSTGKYTHLLSLCCQANAVDWPQYSNLRTQQFLRAPLGGAISSVGPTRGYDSVYYNRYFDEFMQQYNEWEGHAYSLEPTIGDLHLRTKNALLREYSWDPKMELFCEMMVLLGDPLMPVWGPLSELFELTSVAEVVGRGLPDVAILGPAIPNPFNPRTTISYSVPTGTEVRLSIYGVNGRLVEVLVDKFVSAGQHKAVWDGTSAGYAVSSGIYLYRLEAAGQVQTRKVVLLR